MQAYTQPIRANRLGFRRSTFPPGLLAAALFLFLTGGLGPNTWLAFLSIIVLIAGCALVWRPGEPPILLFSMVYSWFQASISIFYANWLGVSVLSLAPFNGDMLSAILLSLGGLLTAALGKRIGAGPWRPQVAWAIREHARKVPLERWLKLYAIAWIVSFSALTFAWAVPGLSQPMLGLAAMKWAFFFVLFYAGFAGAPRKRYWLLIVFLVELASGIGSYFSDFKTVFFVTILAVLASRIRFSPIAWAGLASFAATLIAFGIVWTSVKGEFRNFVSGGEAAQIVKVDYTNRLEKLSELVGELDANKVSIGIDSLLRRLTYVEFFGAVLTYVPSSVPHENGALLWDAVTRPFMPRLFFPDKSVIDDSSRTNQYTGLSVAGADKGTSISLGWIAETYIDFGQYGMFPAIFAMGFFYGRIYRKLLQSRTAGPLLGSALGTAVLIGTVPLESSFTKVFGGVIVSFLAAWLVIKLAVPRFKPWIAA